MLLIKFNNFRLLIKYIIFFKVLIYFNRNIVLTLNGGLGDVILDSYFIKQLRKKFPNKKIILYYRDDDSEGNAEEFSFGKTRKYLSSDNNKINPIKEWLDCLKKINIIDDAHGINIDLKTFGMRIYPEVFGKIFKNYSPSDFKINIIDKIFSDVYHPSEKVKNIISEIKDYNTISLHLRRNANKIIEFANEIEKKENVLFLILGSTEHQAIPEFEFKNQISLIDSYSQNLNLLDVLFISSKSKYFIGGRGGFELFHWLYCVDSINFFDEVGYREIKTGWWNKNLWEENQINYLFNTNSKMDDVIKFVEL